MYNLPSSAQNQKQIVNLWSTLIGMSNRTRELEQAKENRKFQSIQSRQTEVGMVN